MENHSKKIGNSVIKSSGDIVDFDFEKLRNSLEKSKASKELIAEILNSILDEYYDGITTREIYQKAYAMLRHQEHHAAGRYKLKNAIMELGPTGYPFEKFVGELYRMKNYSIQIGVIIPGHCVLHEVDVVATNKKEKVIIECKFHSDQNRFSDVKIPMYIRSRFEDIAEEYEKIVEESGRKLIGFIYTNTRFTKDALQYAICKSMNLVGWDFPKINSLREQIDASGLYPITCLTQLTLSEKQKLLEMEIVLVRDLCITPHLLEKIGVKRSKRYKSIIDEAQVLSNFINHE